MVNVCRFLSSTPDAPVARHHRPDHLRPILSAQGSRGILTQNELAEAKQQ
ncbi:MAG: hypothetical protein J6R04_03655 [Clostridia bacterium]|nr:hypothetical protein [Clostridia bacterium]